MIKKFIRWINGPPSPITKYVQYTKEFDVGKVTLEIKFKSGEVFTKEFVGNVDEYTFRDQLIINSAEMIAENYIDSCHLGRKFYDEKDDITYYDIELHSSKITKRDSHIITRNLYRLEVLDESISI